MRTFRGILLAGVIYSASTGFAQVRSVADEVNIGVRLATEFERRVPLNRDPATLALVDRVGQILTRNSDARFPIHFQVIDSSDVNVFILGGGFVYVTTGLIAAAATEAELASTLAYGIAHYSPKVESKSVTSGLFGGGSTLLPEPSAQLPMTVVVRSALSPTFVAGWSAQERASVERADRLALQFLHRAGYDATAYANLLQSLEARLLPVKVEVQRHPHLKDRIRKLQEWTRKDFPARPESAVTTSEFDRVRRDLQ